MEPSLIVSLISAASALIVVIVTYVFSKRREQDVEWRKLKLDHYKAYIVTLSGVIGTRSTAENQARYADAVNALHLVAPSSVISALYKFQEVISYKNGDLLVELHNAALTELLNKMRADVHSSLAHKHKLIFQLFDVPNSRDEV